MGAEFRFCKMKSSCGWTVKMAAQQYECPRCHGIICLKTVKTVNFVLGICPHSEKKNKASFYLQFLEFDPEQEEV